MRTLNVYLAANAVMYLPIYVAQEKGIFNTLLQDTEVNLIPAKGDYDAIVRMCDDNSSVERNTFAIAIADPNSIRDAEEARIIGALIDRLSFWGVSKKRTNCNLTGIKNKTYHKVVHYDTNLITGHTIGLKVREIEQISSSQTIQRLGDEFNYLDDDTMIITPDLLNVAQRCVEGVAHINYHFAQADRYMPNTYITTAIITSKWCIEPGLDVSDKLVRIIEAIQKAKSIIYSSKQIAREILLNMECIRLIEDQDKKIKVADFIIQTINEDRIYPSDMNISEDQWKITNSNSSIGFSDCIYNEIVLRAERCIADQFGITVNDTFADILANFLRPYQEKNEALLSEVSELNKRIGVLNLQITKLKNNLIVRVFNWIARNWLLFVTLLYAVVFLISKFVFHMNWAESPAAAWCLSTIAIPILINIITSVSEKKKKSQSENNQNA